MAATFDYFIDPALSIVFDIGGGAVLDFDDQTADLVIYWGSPDDTKKAEADSNPGVDPITLSIADAAPASGQETTSVKLATSLAGLDSAIAGDLLSLGAVVNGGPAGAVPVHVRFTDITGGATTLDVDLSLVLPTIKESKAI